MATTETKNPLFMWYGIGIIVVIALIAAYAIYQQRSGSMTQPSDTSAANAISEGAVRTAVTNFGAALQMVSVLAPADTVAQTMEENYAMYVAPELLAQWEKDPAHAPGRTTSSPAPDRIDITAVNANADGTYTVQGNVVESLGTGTAKVTDTQAYPVTMTLQNQNGSWLITSFQGYPPQA